MPFLGGILGVFVGFEDGGMRDKSNGNNVLDGE